MLLNLTPIFDQTLLLKHREKACSNISIGLAGLILYATGSLEDPVKNSISLWIICAPF